MSTATDSRAVLVAALEAKGVDVVEDPSGDFSAPVAMIEAGEPWISRDGMTPGSALISWRIVCIADRGGDAGAIADDLLAVALPVYHVLGALQGWSRSNISGQRVVPETVGNYVAVELTTSTPIDITEGT